MKCISERESTALSHQELVRNLKSLGIGEGAELLVHSSLSSIGYVENGATGVIEALLSALNPASGTLLVPTITAAEADSPDNPPVFNVRQTLAWTGKIAQTLWQRPDAVRSLGPTHSVAAIGVNAVHLTTGHEDCWTPCGYGSPYYRLARRGGSILLLGTTLDCNTSLHMCEEITGCKYHLYSQPAICTITDEQGKVFQRPSRIHEWRAPRRFNFLTKDYLKLGIMREGRIGAARSYLIDARLALEYTLDRLKLDPCYLVDQEWLKDHPLSE